MTDENPRAFKHAIDEAVVERYAAALAGPGFDASGFRRAALDGLSERELKDRVTHVADCLFRAFGGDFRVGLGRLLDMLAASEAAPDDALAEMAFWPMAQFVEDHGLSHFDVAVPAMKQITRRFSCEFAVRPFLVHHPERMLAEMQAWARDPDVHVRRNASEGLRPRLPWGARLRAFVDDPGPVLEVLEILRDDPELYVRRSVANCLNDIAKDHPDRVMAVLERWNREPGEHTAWITQRALRTLVKAGHPRALAILGFGPPKVRIDDLRTDAGTYVVGDTAVLSFTLVSTTDTAQQLVVDYRVHFVKANGTRSPKVFKLTTLTLGPGERRELTRRQHLRPITTRRYHAGTHLVDVQVNGVACEPVSFELKLPRQIRSESPNAAS